MAQIHSKPLICRNPFAAFMSSLNLPSSLLLSSASTRLKRALADVFLHMLGSFSYQADSFKLSQGKINLCAWHWVSPSSEFGLQLMTFPAKQLKTNQLSLCVKFHRFGSIWSWLQPKTTHRHPLIFFVNFTSTINIFSSGRLVFPLLKRQRVMPAFWPFPRAKLKRPRRGWTLYSPVSSQKK